jgi:hypothetical protein
MGDHVLASFDIKCVKMEPANKLAKKIKIILKNR